MKTKELIELLEKMPPNMEITISKDPDIKTIERGMIAAGEWHICYQDLSYEPVTTKVSEYKAEILRRCTKNPIPDIPRDQLDKWVTDPMERIRLAL